MTKAKAGGAASAASVGGVAATSTESTASNPSPENQTPATSVDSAVSAGAADQPKAPPDQSGDSAGNAESKATDSAAGASLENQTPATSVDQPESDAVTAPVLDLWVLNSGVKAITESRTRTLLAVDRTTQINISSPQVRATVIRNLEQLNHLAGAEYLKVVDQPPILDKVE